jgi:hypothetical protein
MGIVETTGAFVRASARTRAWEKAEKKARLMDAEAADPSPASVTVEHALDAFIARFWACSRQKGNYGFLVANLLSGRLSL